MKYDKKRIDEFFEITYEKYKDQLEPFFKEVATLSIPEENIVKLKEAFLLAFLMRDEDVLNGHPSKDIVEYVKEFASEIPAYFTQPLSIKTHIPKSFVMPIRVRR